EVLPALGAEIFLVVRRARHFADEGEVLPREVQRADVEVPVVRVVVHAGLRRNGERVGVEVAAQHRPVDAVEEARSLRRLHRRERTKFLMYHAPVPSFASCTSLFNTNDSPTGVPAPSPNAPVSPYNPKSTGCVASARC